MEPILLIVVPLILAFISIGAKPLAKYLMPLGVAFNVVTVFLIEKGTYVIGGFKPPFGISLVVDTYALYSVMFLNILFALVIILAIEHTGKIQGILLVGLAALNGMLMTGDLFNLFVFLEIASIVAYLIVASDKKYLAVFNYLVMATVGSSMYLLGIVILYAQYGTLNMQAMSDAMIAQASMGDYYLGLSAVPLILIFLGLGVEVKLVPVNGWVKGVLEKSTPLVSTMIASVYAGTMLMVFGRLFVDVFVLSENLKLIFAIIAVVTVFAGEVAAFASKKLRTILLYSSVAQSGLAVLLFVYGLASLGILVVVANVLVKFVMFMIASHIGEGGTDELDQIKGLFRNNPLNGLAFTIAAMSLIGLPMFFGFAVKMNVLMGLFDNGLWWVPIVVLTATLIEGAYVIRMLVGLWNPGNEGEYATTERVTHAVYPIRQYVCMVTLLISLCLVVLGLVPSQMVEGAKEAGAGLRGSATYGQMTEKGGN